MSPQIVLQSESEPMGVNHGLGWHGDGVGVSPRKLAQTKKKVENSQIVPTKWV